MERHIKAEKSLLATPPPACPEEAFYAHGPEDHAAGASAPLACLEMLPLALWALTSRHTNPLFLMPQVRRWPAWKCVSYADAPSHQGTPTSPPTPGRQRSAVRHHPGRRGRTDLAIRFACLSRSLNGSLVGTVMPRCRGVLSSIIFEQS